MCYRNLMLLLASLLVLPALGWSQTIVASDSYVSFSIANYKINTVEGKITGMQGTVQFDPSRLAEAAFEVCVDPSTISTGIGKRDAHLKTADFFHVEKYPRICFTSQRITRKGDAYEVTGILDMHGVQRTVSIPFSYKNQTLQGEVEIDRFDYELAAESYSSTFMVGKTAKVSITCKVQ